MVVFDMYMIFGLCYMMWAILTGTSTTLKKKKNQVKSPSPQSRTSNSVRIRQSGRAGNRGVTLTHHQGQYILEELTIEYAETIQAVGRWGIELIPKATIGRPCTRMPPPMLKNVTAASDRPPSQSSPA